MIVGNVDKIGEMYTVDIRLVDVQTGKVEKTASEDCDNCSLSDIAKTTMNSVAQNISGTKKVESPPPTVVTPPKPEVQKKQVVKKTIKKETKAAEQLKEKKRLGKSPALGAFYSFFIPGAGHWYYGNYKKGTIYFLSHFGFMAFNFGSLTFFDKSIYNYTFFPGLGISGAMYIFSPIETAMSISKDQAKLKKKYDITFYPTLENGNPKLNLSLNF